MPDSRFAFADINGSRYGIDAVPATCPLCHRAIHATEHKWHLVPPSERFKPTLEIMYGCPHHECGRYFIARYRLVTGMSNSGFRLVSTSPWDPKPPEVPEVVSEISPTFVEVYEQAFAAEAFHLPQVAGPGYRKALEFLIKDYCTSSDPAKADAIRALPLGSVINQHVADGNVKACAQRATWLGNDETHYVRKWESKDIEDLKTLLKLTVNWIENEQLTKKYVADMNQGPNSQQSG